jgi:hypothetical protein
MISARKPVKISELSVPEKEVPVKPRTPDCFIKALHFIE